MEGLESGFMDDIMLRAIHLNIKYLNCMLQSMGLQRVGHDWVTELNDIRLKKFHWDNKMLLQWKAEIEI